MTYYGLHFPLDLVAHYQWLGRIRNVLLRSLLSTPLCTKADSIHLRMAIKVKLILRPQSSTANVSNAQEWRSNFIYGCVAENERHMAHLGT